jgi:hypothetical protein
LKIIPTAQPSIKTFVGPNYLAGVSSFKQAIIFFERKVASL